MREHEFSNWLNKMQINLIDKHGKQSISEEVKREKLLNNLPPHVNESLKLQIEDDWTYERIVLGTKSYEAPHKKHRNTIPTRQRSKQVSYPVHHPIKPPQSKDLKQ